MPRRAIIIGAGPAGLTAAFELLEHTDIIPIILEADSQIGGLSRTINYKGNRMDLGGHRFFSKSDKVMQWWLRLLPIDPRNSGATITYQNKHTHVTGTAGTIANNEEVMLLVNRVSRIYFLKKLFNYPIRLNKETLRNLGFWRITRIGFSYIRAKLFPLRREKTLEDFFINRFGKELYQMFFKDYTEKVWGIPTSQISAEWGAQRVKGLSLGKTIRHFLFSSKKKKQGIEQKQTETSLIEKFLYPKFGPGQLWEIAAREITRRGGQIIMNQQVQTINNNDHRIESITAIDKETGKPTTFPGDYFISSMPVKDLVKGMNNVPAAIQQVANGLVYRDFIIVGILLKDLQLKNADGTPILDNWLYIQEKNVKLGRVQVYNNWGDSMVAKPGTFWLGLEYFCNEGDELWELSDEEMIHLAIQELESINIAKASDVLDAMMAKVPKTYPSYVGAYEQFDMVREYIDTFDNLFLIGRNGMHKYNNQDHSMLTAMQAVENIRTGSTDKAVIWAINTEQEYHEENSGNKNNTDQ